MKVQKVVADTTAEDEKSLLRLNWSARRPAFFSLHFLVTNPFVRLGKN